MRDTGLWHPRLVELIADMGHTDTLVLADAGLPIPHGIEAIDLLWWRGQPPLIPLLERVLAELVVEQVTIADEAKDPVFLADFERVIKDIPVVRTSHDTLKERCFDARAIVRTGEATRYSNVMLHAGVPF